MDLLYISDTNIWIDFRHAGLLSTLFELPFSICCTDFVLDELDDFDHDDLKGHGLQIIELDEPSVEQLIILTDNHNNSSLADVSCYFLAKSTGYPLLTGDGQLRKQAANDGLTVHGALWLLDRMVEHQLISRLQAAIGLQKMLDSSARLPKAECEKRFSTWSDL